MEDTPKEIELNFNSSDDGNISETAGSDTEFSQAPEVVGIAVEQEQYTAAAEDFQDDSAEKKLNNDSEMLLRSRYPANCPLGTPPLEKSTENPPVSAVEMAISGRSYGSVLRILREQNNLTYKELEQITRIQPHYLEALENENLKALPQLVYVIAYIRSLCRFYQLSEDTSNTLVAKLKEQLEFTCNDELMNTLDIDRSGAAANERQLRKILWIIAGMVTVLVAVIVLLVVLLTGGREEQNTVPSVADVSAASESTAAGNGKFDSNTVYSLLEPPTLVLPKLPVAE